MGVTFNPEVKDMKPMWNVIAEQKMQKETKTALFIGSMILITALSGFFVWLVLGKIWFPKIDEMLCFIGYPMMLIGCFGSTCYLYQHEFS